MQIDFSIVSENLAMTYGDVITPPPRWVVSGKKKAPKIL
jgi:hypothetical protein